MLQKLLYEHCENEEILDKTYVEIVNNYNNNKTVDKLLLLEYKHDLDKYSKSLEEIIEKVDTLKKIVEAGQSKKILYKKYFTFVTLENENKDSDEPININKEETNTKKTNPNPKKKSFFSA